MATFDPTGAAAASNTANRMGAYCPGTRNRSSIVSKGIRIGRTAAQAYVSLSVKSSFIEIWARYAPRTIIAIGPFMEARVPITSLSSPGTCIGRRKRRIPITKLITIGFVRIFLKLTADLSFVITYTPKVH